MKTDIWKDSKENPDKRIKLKEKNKPSGTPQCKRLFITVVNELYTKLEYISQGKKAPVGAAFYECFVHLRSMKEAADGSDLSCLICFSPSMCA